MCRHTSGFLSGATDIKYYTCDIPIFLCTCAHTIIHRYTHIYIYICVYIYKRKFEFHISNPEYLSFVLRLCRRRKRVVSAE
jgi:hypothetical protein